jgi:hypothetical protein
MGVGAIGMGVPVTLGVSQKYIRNFKLHALALSETNRNLSEISSFTHSLYQHPTDSTEFKRNYDSIPHIIPIRPSMLNPLQVRSYRIEYESTDISIEHLRMKYKIPEGLDTSSWKKQSIAILPPVPIEPLPANPAPLEEDQPNIVIEMLDDILTIKQSAIARIKTWMADDAEYAEVKEFKDMLAVVDGIEKSIRPQAPAKAEGVTIQVLVQNLMQEFQRDC